MTTDIAQNIADDGAAVADTACPDSDAASRLSSSRTLMSFRKAAK